MSFGGQTPEALLGRSDSRNPSTTCRGLTTAGKSCRRSVVPSKTEVSLGSSYDAWVNDRGARVADPTHFCWQHKDQIVTVAVPAITSDKARRKLVTVTERTSIDSLTERLGVSRLDDPDLGSHQPARLTTSNNVNQPHQSNHHTHYRAQEPMQQWRSAKKDQPPRHSERHPPSFWASLCCFTNATDDDTYYEIVRHQRHPPGSQRNAYNRHRASVPRVNPQMQQVSSRPAMLLPNLAPPPTAQVMPRRPVSAQRKALSDLPANLGSRQQTALPSQKLMSYIPKHLTPSSTALLLAELAKPISPHDNEGYIYIFWLTDTPDAPDAGVAASLLSASTATSSDVGSLARTYSVANRHKIGERTIMLKIGRASNVHRRMTEWKQQCGRSLNLVRFYPYMPSTPQTSPVRNSGQRDSRDAQERPEFAHRSSSGTAIKVPHVHRVERLIHLELADQRVKRGCDACGKEHREWFEVKATEKGIRAVDATVRKWVSWAQNHSVE